MGIKIRLFIAATLTIATVMGFALWSERHQTRIGAVMQTVLAENVSAMNTATELKGAFVLYDDLMLRFMLTGDQGLLNEARRHEQVARSRLIQIKKNSRSPTIQNLAESLSNESEGYFGDVARLHQFSQKYQFPEGGPIEIVAVWGKQFPAHKKELALLSASGQRRLARIYDICDKLLDINRIALEKAQENVESLLNEGRQAAQWAAWAVFAATGLVAIGFALSLLAPLKNLLDGVKRVVDGNLNFEIPITSGDEIGTLTQAFNTMTRNLRAKQETLLRETITDELTGAYNFRYFQEMLKRETGRALRHERPSSLLIVDIDHFKNYNDSQGHEMGNVILKTIAQMIKETLRAEDILARYGGEEFAILLPDTRREQALIAAERLRVAIETASLPGSNKQPLGRITVSIGGAACPDDAQTSQALFEKADKALYQAKSQGRNRVGWNI